ncbi:hypothetical protein UG86_09235 [Staphylococcus aureus]|nr:hypothetical protein UG86_09235 [Staphylococcus aureus]PZG58621.1 hypothetical protein C7R35_09940 [Staphylococcus aureus]PZG66621.1 hypothetical protein C7R27_11160 [Staphylococcus aureus]PZG92144.1 hypothetical protein C7R24_09940 [Staphylococcus aureus]PZI34479.1 hypothetical protein C7R37_13090 [Staphylococcus aureus]
MNKNNYYMQLKNKILFKPHTYRVQNIQVVLIYRYVTFDFKRKVKVVMFVLVLNYFALDDMYF